MTKVGIIRCRNLTQEMGCCSYMCLKELNRGAGHFARYAESGGAELMGIISCAGCPTAVVPERILSRVRALVDLGAEAVHLSSCLEYVCPFKNKYKFLIERDFPKVKVVVGTHGYVRDKETSQKMFREIIKSLLNQPRQSMTDVFRYMLEQESRRPAGDLAVAGQN